MIRVVIPSHQNFLRMRIGKNGCLKKIEIFKNFLKLHKDYTSTDYNQTIRSGGYEL